MWGVEGGMEWRVCEGRPPSGGVEQGKSVGDLSGSFTSLVTVL